MLASVCFIIKYYDTDEFESYSLSIALVESSARIATGTLITEQAEQLLYKRLISTRLARDAYL